MVTIYESTIKLDTNNARFVRIPLKSSNVLVFWLTNT